uniref:Bone morphogenetic protein 10, like n=1 Tax=Sphaeramia orbicularis TaxID=375764 RepID=A0A672ZCZ2_9TELE
DISKHVSTALPSKPNHKINKGKADHTNLSPLHKRVRPQKVDLCRFIRVLGVLLVVLTGFWSSCNPIHTPENHRRASAGRDGGDNPLLDAQDFLSQFLSTLNLTEQRPQPRSSRPRPVEEPPEYMLELYERFANDRTAVPSANIVRSFKNEDSSPYSISARGVKIHPLLFNISIPHHEHIRIAELRLFTLIQKAQRPYAKEVVEMKDLEELVTKHFRATDKSWVSFDLTHAVTLWRKSGCATQRLEAHVTNLGLTEVDISRSLEGKHNAVMIVFSDDQSRDHKQEKQELNLMIEHENDRLENQFQSQQSNLIYDTPARIRRNVESQPCKRTPLFVDFKDIGWDTWIIQPLGYEAYECNGVCNPPMTDEVSPTKHAIVQTLLSVKDPDKVSRACCVPTKLEPISLLYHDDGAITFNHKYEGMVVAECGCR